MDQEFTSYSDSFSSVPVEKFSMAIRSETFSARDLQPKIPKRSKRKINMIRTLLFDRASVPC